MEDVSSETEKKEESLRSIDGNKEEKKVPSSMTVNVPSRMVFQEQDTHQRRKIPKGLFAVLVSMGVLLIAGVITVAVMLITQPDATAAVGSARAIQTAEPTKTVSPTPTPTPVPTPVPTTAPEESDDFSAIFDTPENEILQKSQNQ